MSLAPPSSLPRNPRDRPPALIRPPPPEAHVARPPRSGSSLQHRPFPQLGTTTYSGLPSGPRSARPAPTASFPTQQPPRPSSSNHSLLASLDTPSSSPLRTRARGAPFPTLPAVYAGGQRSHSRGSSVSSGVESELFEWGEEGREDSGDETSVNSGRWGVWEGRKRLEVKSRADDVGPLLSITAPTNAYPSTPRTTSYHGHTLWSSLVSAASSTARAWQETFFTDAGDEDYDDRLTPDGETRVTAVLKSYYIDRAQSRDDLPGWLFGPVPPSTAGPLSPPNSAFGPRSANPLLSPIPTSPSASPLRSAPLPNSRATDRLRAIREERRARNLALSDGGGDREGLAGRARVRRGPDVERTAEGRI